MTEPDTRRETRRIGVFMIAGAWLAVLALLSIYFNNVLDAQYNPNQDVAGQVTEHGIREVKLRQNRNGHYVANGTINGESVRFLLDTGATEVSVPERLASRLGLSRGLPSLVQTANGTVTTYTTRLAQISLGEIRMRDVRAHINPHMYDDEVLLGMSFLRDLELVQREAELTLRQYP